MPFAWLTSLSVAQANRLRIGSRKRLACATWTLCRRRRGALFKRAYGLGINALRCGLRLRRALNATFERLFFGLLDLCQQTLFGLGEHFGIARTHGRRAPLALAAL